MTIDALLEQLKNLDFNTLDLSTLYDFAIQIDLKSLEVKEALPEIEDPANYARNILMMKPIEAVLLRWPPGVASAVHHHKGFWGVVGVISGQLENRTFEHSGGKLKESTSEFGLPGGWVREEDGVIHLLQNASSSEEAVTLHIYYPPLESFEGMEIFHLEESKIGVLNDRAQTASWAEPSDHFKEILEEAFSYVPQGEDSGPSHRISPVIPKPEKSVIQELIGAYYAEQAHLYDHFDSAHVSRNKYIQRVNQLIADDLSAKLNVDSYLAIACGTGRRMLRIQEMTQRSYDLHGVDLSTEMCEVAEERGIHMHCAPWLKADLEGELFSAISFLYAFGHIASHDDRLRSLKKMADHLQPGGKLYMDVFNVNDQNEWGPRAVEVFEELKLDQFGYERGDVFYKKSGGEATAYLHYFDEEEIRGLIESVGLSVKQVYHVGYTKQAGDLLENSTNGVLFIIAEKR